MLENPFRPGFGSWPPEFVGRDVDEILFREGLSNGPGSRYYRSLITGPRGVGKTVLLAAFRDIAEQAGYVTVAVDANDGMIRRICRDLRSVEDALDDNPTWKLNELGAGLSLGVVSGRVDAKRQELNQDEDPMVLLKPLLERVEAIVTDRGGAGLLLTVDEIHAASTKELERLGNDLQHVQSIVFAGAALPTVDDQIFATPGGTFFSRLARFSLEPLTLADSVAALRPPLDEHDLVYDDVELTAVAHRTKGYPYLVQLLGYEIWSRLSPGDDITEPLLSAAFDAAQAQSIFDVLAPSWRQLSPSSRRVLGVIAAGGSGRVATADVIAELGKSHSWFSVYRSRLIKAGLMYAPERGFVQLTTGDQGAEWIRAQVMELE